MTGASRASTITRTSAWRMAAIGLFLVAPLCLIAFGALNMLDAIYAQSEVTRDRASLSELVARLQRHRTDRLSAEDVSKLYLSSRSDSLAAAELQTRLADLIRQSGGRLREAQAADPSLEASGGIVSLMMSLDIDNVGLLDLLYGIEAGLPLMTISDLTVQRVDREEEAPTQGARLKVAVTVAAHWKRKDP